MSRLAAVSVVIPVYNESESLGLLHERLKSVLGDVKCQSEIIYVDDGSTDNSFSILQAIAAQEKNVTVVRFRRNFGQTAAISAGIDQAQGEAIVFMDADLQNDPADIPKLLAVLEQGYDIVSGWRANRQDAWLSRKLPSVMANALISWATGVPLHDYGCTLKAYRREVLTGFRLYGEMHRFIPALAAQTGARITEITVQHHARKFGKSKYGLQRTFKVILDLLTVKFLSSFSTSPIYLFGGTGLLVMAASILIVIYLLARKILFAESLIESPLLLMSAMLFILSFQSLMMGLITELLMRTYHESQNKPIYRVRELINGKVNG